MAIAEIVIIWIFALPVGLGGFAHTVAGAAEILTAVWEGQVAFGDYVGWLVPATLGNAVGGVVMVSLLNYGQVVGSGDDRDLAMPRRERVLRRALAERARRLRRRAWTRGED